VVIAGGCGQSVEVLTGDLETKQLPILPRENYGSSMVLQNGTILLCGRVCRGWNSEQKCLQLDHGTWNEHSTLNVERFAHSAVTTQTATFVFGGTYSRTTYEYLPKDSTTWLMGKTEFPGGFSKGGAIAVKSDQEIWLIGGCRTEQRILSFNVIDHTFQELPSQLNVKRRGHSCAFQKLHSQLNVGRRLHRCAFIPNTNKVLITGGYNYNGSLDSTEILDTEDGSVKMASPMKSKRAYHGMGVVTINGEERLAVFGGFNGRTRLDSVELYNTQTEKWETTDIKLKEANSEFGFLSVKLADVVSHL